MQESEYRKKGGKVVKGLKIFLFGKNTFKLTKLNWKIIK